MIAEKKPVNDMFMTQTGLRNCGKYARQLLVDTMLAGQLKVVENYASPAEVKKVEVKEESIERQSSRESLNHLSKSQMIEQIKERLVKVIKEK